MNINTALLGAAMALMALPLAAQENQLSAPIRIVGSAHIEKTCFGQNGMKVALARRDMARGFGRAWTDAMEPLRAKANQEAAELCWQGEEGVSFTFIRANDARELSMTTGKSPVLASATSADH